MFTTLREITLNRWHKHLCTHFSWYDHWHQYPRHGHVHALVLSAFFVGMMFGVIFQLNFVAPTLAAAGINKQIQYEGKLTNPSGVAVSDGTYSMVFKLYTVATGGSAVWTETQSVSVATGYFSVLLGSVTSLSSVDFNSDEYYLGVKVGTDAEMTPRKRIGAAAYAFNADRLGGTDSASFVTLTGSQTLTNKTLQGAAAQFTTGTATDDMLIIAPKTGGAAGFSGTITSTELTAAHSYTFPNVTGSVPLNTDGTSLFFTTTGGADNALTLPASGTLATLSGTETLANKTLTTPIISSLILDTNGREIIKLTATTNAVNDINISNNSAGVWPRIDVNGSDDNIGFRFGVKGTEGGLAVGPVTGNNDVLAIRPPAVGAGNQFAGYITSADLTAERTWTFPDTTGTIALLETAAPLASPTFTGTVTIPTPFTLGAVSVLPTGTELNFVDGVTSAIQTQLDAKAPLASPTFTSPILGNASATTINGSSIDTLSDGANFIPIIKVYSSSSTSCGTACGGSGATGCVSGVNTGDMSLITCADTTTIARACICY